MKYYPMAKPVVGPTEIKAVVKVLKSGYLSLGPKVLEFEKQFAKFIGTRYACAASSGTAGLHLAIMASGIGPGDEVITSPFSFVASANCILYAGATPVFADIDPVTYNLDPAEVAKKITKRTKAILPVHIFGQSVDMAPLMRLSKIHKLKVIEDACESIGADYGGKRVGTFGEAAVFAFYPNKQMTTGEGGMVVTNNQQVYKTCKSLANQGRGDNMQWLDHQRLGYNYRLDEMSAALGLAQIKRISALIKGRRMLADWYTAFFNQFSDLVQIPRIAPGNTHTWFVYVLKIVNHNIKRDQVIADLKKRGISSKPYLPSIHLFDFYRKQFGHSPGSFPVSEEMSTHSLALPFYHGLRKSDITHIGNALIKILRTYEKRIQK
ncbi:MAG: DegT/DnrJ/EryC1/StrS family aminotransferase [Candidatus Magasanikbacteria bacterium]|nr:DegT/DnrJ/EryC1/StrS family aminotransferase [Candidatus Magasanikbacteria bacterium]